jgi:nitroreductase
MQKGESMTQATASVDTSSTNPVAAGQMPGASDPSHWSTLQHLVRVRRSNLRIDPDAAVAPAVLQELLELACWAPHHGRTNPWRFGVVTGAGRERFGNGVAEAMRQDGVTEPALLEKARTKYLRSPVVLVVGSAAHDREHLHRENCFAVSAGVQNLLLGATALGLASFWASPPNSPLAAARVKSLAGLNERDELVGIVYLGWPVDKAPDMARNAPTVTRLDA